MRDGLDLMPRLVVTADCFVAFEYKNAVSPFPVRAEFDSLGLHQLWSLEPVVVFANETAHLTLNDMDSPGEIVVRPVENIIQHSIAGHFLQFRTSFVLSGHFRSVTTRGSAVQPQANGLRHLACVLTTVRLPSLALDVLFCRTS